MSDRQTPADGALDADRPSASPATPPTDHHAGLPADKVMETSWRWRLLLVDAVLALALAWILWDLLRGQDQEAAAGDDAPPSLEAPAGDSDSP